jgi:ribonuclease D
VADTSPSRLPTRDLSPEVVSTQENLDRLLVACAQAPQIAIDTEAASFHRHHDRIYLIQVSTRNVTAVIDPLADLDLVGFGDLLADPAREVVFHDGDYDLRLMDRQYGFHARNLFDPADMLSYAATDTHFLLELRDLLRERLREMGRLSWCEEEFEHIVTVRWTAGEDREHAFLKMKGARELTPRSLGILGTLWQWREHTADRIDRAAFRILGNEAMLELARSPVKTLDELAQQKGVGRQTAGRWGKEILEAIGDGQKMRERDLPRFERTERRPIDRQFQARVERLKKARNEVAGRLDLAPGVVCPNGTLEAIARAEPDTLEALARVPNVRRWQAATFGQDLLDTLGVRTP